MAGESPDKSEQRKSSGEATPGEIDPRLAVFGQASSGAAAPRVDQPTAVFKLPTEASSSGASAGAGPVETDTRLRAAVAAWVTNDDEAADADEVADTDVDADTDAGGSASDEAEALSDATGEVTPDVSEEAAEAEDSTPEDEPAEEPEDEPEDEPAEEPEAPAARPEEAADAEDPAPEAPEAPEADEAGPVPASEAEASTPPEAGAEEASADEAEQADEAERADEAKASPSAADVADSDTDEAAEDEAEDEGGDEAEDESPASGADARAVPKWAAPDKAEAPGKDDASADANVTPGADKPLVDQPTGVFRAPRRPAVDQATTALKLPSEPKPKPKPGPEAEPEADAPRSSTFVPLRRDSAPQPPAPAPASASASAPPAVAEAERTRQQPMPPLPPLDLLAELTNTPPPRQTPVRTVVRRVKIWTPLALLLLIIFAVVQAVRPLPAPQLALSAVPTYTFKGAPLSLPWPGEGQGAVEVEGVGSLGAYGVQKPAPIASVAKTMTAYVILKEHPISGKEVGERIEVDQQAEDESKNEDESTAQISKGQQFTQKQMLQLLMIPSGNNAARLLARWDAGDEAAFVTKMNAAAKDLGMTNSTYTDPSGLKATTVSTPADQLKLAKAVMQNDVFRGIVDTTNTSVPGIDGNIRNNNDRALIEDGVGGIKTGSSTPAGGNLLWAANAVVDGKIRRIVGITMGAQDAAFLNDKLELAITYSIEVIKAAQEGLTSAVVIKKGDVVGYIDDGLGGRTAVVATKELKPIGWAGLKVEIALTAKDESLPHSGKAGDVVGEVSVGSGTGKVTAPVALQQDLAEPGLGDKLVRLG